MGNMLKSTNNEIKNVNIDKTIGIAIDWNWPCIITTVLYIIAIIGIIALSIVVWPAAVGLALLIDMFVDFNILPIADAIYEYSMPI